MATSLSLSKFSSFLLPSNPPPKVPPPTQLSLPNSLPQKHKDSNFSTVYSKSSYNVEVIVGENEPEETLLNRFRREVMRAGIIQECKRRRFRETEKDERLRKAREAAKRNRRRRYPSRPGSFREQEQPTAKVEEPDDDNWELPEGGLPY